MCEKSERSKEGRRRGWLKKARRSRDKWQERQREKLSWLKQSQVQEAGVTCMVKWFAECQVTAHPVISCLKAPP